MISADLGLGTFSSLSEQGQLNFVDEAQEAAKAWMEAYKGNQQKLKTPLQNLLAEHFEISEKILDIQDEESPGIEDRKIV